MLRKAPLLVIALAGLLGRVQAQKVTNVSEIITDYGGFWQSSAATLNPTQPDNSHDLLAFSIDGVRYSTGVDDALLTRQNVSFVAGSYRALPVAAIGTPTSNTKIGLGALYDKVPNGPGNPPPANDPAAYLRDGRNGLNIGTGVANIPSGTISFDISSINNPGINDNVPDILVTQFADPASSQDQYQFTDENDRVIGQTVTVVFTSIPPVGDWVADFYEAAQNPLTLQSGFTQTSRQLRLWTADLSTFGINNGNASRIRKFKILLSGNSDVAFVAYNTQTATLVTPLPVQLTGFSGQAAPTYSDLTWRTAQELNAAYFEVEASPDGQHFTPVGRVAAAGTTNQPRQYRFRHQAPAPGPRYYRLHQIDTDGTSAYSGVVTLAAVGAAPAAQVAVAPNPFRESLQLRLSGSAATRGQVQLTSLAGQAVYEHDISAQLGQPLLTLPHLPALPAGVYVLRVELDGRATFLKVVKE